MMIRTARVADGKVAAVRSIEPPLAGKLACRIREAVSEAIKTVADPPTAAVAAVDGLLDSSSRVLRRSLPRARWEDVDLAATLEEAVGVASTVVRVGEAGALAERAYGAARGLDDFFYLFVDDTDLHGAVIAHGRLKPVVRGSFGQVVVAADSERRSDAGAKGALAAFSSINGMLETRQGLGGVSPTAIGASIQDLRDAVGVRAVEEGGRYMAEALMGAADGTIFAGLMALPCDVVLVGSRDQWLRDQLLAGVTMHLKERISPIEVHAAKFGDVAMLLGAGAVGTLEGS